MKAKVFVTLKNGVFDPQGKVVQRSLATLGYAEVEHARIGKYIELDLKETNPQQAEVRVKEMCQKLLANTVIESYKIQLES
ncbi:MAG: phosphoribosylformylglycinamidine synthase subunit PurS [Deltaproteobacteria bacterium]|nr:MAG: phosphoribosylformylglycinamidine synthase subunit PurS [Deltaproteobacteria bacterium]